MTGLCTQDDQSAIFLAKRTAPTFLLRHLPVATDHVDAQAARYGVLL